MASIKNSTSHPQTLYDKIWAKHLIEQRSDGSFLLYIDRHLVHEVTSPQAFRGIAHGRAQSAPPRRDLGSGRS